MNHRFSYLGASRTFRRALATSVAAGLGLLGSTASAATFPADPAWVAVQQKGSGYGDVATDGQNNGREIVGSAADPAVFLAVDATHFFVRLRLDTSPPDVETRIIAEQEVSPLSCGTSSRGARDVGFST